MTQIKGSILSSFQKKKKLIPFNFLIRPTFEQIDRKIEVLQMEQKLIEQNKQDFLPTPSPSNFGYYEEK